MSSALEIAREQRKKLSPGTRGRAREKFEAVWRGENARPRRRLENNRLTKNQHCLRIRTWSNGYGSHIDSSGFLLQSVVIRTWLSDLAGLAHCLWERSAPFRTHPNRRPSTSRFFGREVPITTEYYQSQKPVLLCPAYSCAQTRPKRPTTDPQVR